MKQKSIRSRLIEMELGEEIKIDGMGLESIKATTGALKSAGHGAFRVNSKNKPDIFVTRTALPGKLELSEALRKFREIGFSEHQISDLEFEKSIYNDPTWKWLVNEEHPTPAVFLTHKDICYNIKN